MNLYSYIITRDYGFAPNPFYGICTLANCKPKIRLKVEIGDWIIGFGSNACTSNQNGKVVFAMKASEKIPFESYWQDPRFQRKKPILNGSKKQMYGDNIYYKDDHGIFQQLNSHHSNPDGSPNNDNIIKDLSGKYVVISSEFWYWGEAAVPIPDDLSRLKHFGIGHSKISDAIEPNICSQFVDWICSFESGYLGDPSRFSRGFERYDGRS